MAMQESNIDHPVFAPLCPKIADRADSRGGAEHRFRLLQGLSRRVIEVERCERLPFTPGALALPIPQILGVVRRR